MVNLCWNKAMNSREWIRQRARSSENEEMAKNIFYCAADTPLHVDHLPSGLLFFLAFSLAKEKHLSKHLFDIFNGSCCTLMMME